MNKIKPTPVPAPELPALGDNLRRERLGRHWSQDELAVASGVSKAMLSQIESGKVNPTIGTLWKIAHALNVDLNLLLLGEPGKPHCFEVARKNDLPLLSGYGDGIEIRVLSGIALADKLEFYRITMAPEASLESRPHYPGSEEIVTLLVGTVEVSAESRSTRLEAGDVIRFACDVPHRIINSGRTAAEIYMIVRFLESPR